MFQPAEVRIRVPAKQPQEPVADYMARTFSVQPFQPEPSLQGLRDSLLTAYVAVAQPLVALETLTSPNATVETRRRLHRIFTPNSTEPLQAGIDSITPDTDQEAAGISFSSALGQVQLNSQAAIETTNALLEVRRQLLAHDQEEIETLRLQIKNQIVTSLARRDFRLVVGGLILGRSYRQRRLQAIEDSVIVRGPSHTPNEELAIQIEKYSSHAQEPGQLGDFLALSQVFLSGLAEFGLHPVVVMGALQMAVEQYYLEEAQPQS